MFRRKKQEPPPDLIPAGTRRVVVWQETITPETWDSRIEVYLHSIGGRRGFWNETSFVGHGKTRDEACAEAHKEIARLERKKASEEVC